MSQSKTCDCKKIVDYEPVGIDSFSLWGYYVTHRQVTKVQVCRYHYLEQKIKRMNKKIDTLKSKRDKLIAEKQKITKHA